MYYNNFIYVVECPIIINEQKYNMICIHMKEYLCYIRNGLVVGYDILIDCGQKKLIFS